MMKRTRISKDFILLLLLALLVSYMITFSMVFLTIREVFFVSQDLVTSSLSHFHVTAQEAFAQRIHENRVILLKDTIQELEDTQEIYTLNKIISSRVEQESIKYGDHIDIPLVDSPSNLRDFFGRLLFWLFCTGICYLVGSYIPLLISDPLVDWKETALYNLSLISNNHNAISEVYSIWGDMQGVEELSDSEI